MEFILVSVMLIFLFLGVAQVALYLHIRNVVAASAAEGARCGANADRGPPDAAAATRTLVGQALNRGLAGHLSYAASVEPGAGGAVLLRVQVRGTVPALLAPMGRLLPVAVTARALQEGQ